MADAFYETLPDLEAYLERIHYTGTRELTRENLNQLVYDHQCAVPFENMDCCLYYRAQAVALDAPHLFEKVVTNRRGGYCFELNGLFVLLLRAFGFNAYSCFCRIARGEALRPVMHRGCVVLLDGKEYFCDVGFGGPMAPFAVECSEEHQTFFGETYWIIPAEGGWRRLMRRRGNGIGDGGERFDEDASVVIYAPMPFMSQDFAAASFQCSGLPTAGFVQRPMVNLRTHDGYLNLADHVFTEVHDGVKESRELTDEEFPAVLLERFGIQRCEYTV